MAWHKCPVCGALLPSAKEADDHCKWYYGKKSCPDCAGTGKVTGFFAPNQTCPRCKGSGTIGLNSNYW